MGCLDNIISIPDCNEIPSLSGFSITDLAGITVKKAANVATEKYMTGLNLLKDVRRKAVLEVKNDIIKFMQSNGLAPMTITSTWNTKDVSSSSVKLATNLGDFRGIVVKSQKRNCLIKKIHIKTVYVMADYDGELILRVEDGEFSYPYPFTSVSGVTNRININFTAEGDELYLLLPDTVDVFHVLPNCQCSGNQKKSDCAKVIGYYNGIETKTEGYGIYADVQCKCVYDYILCQLSTDGLLGEAVMYKAGVNIMDEQIKGDRLNYFTTYGRVQAEMTKAEWENKYIELWNGLIQALPKWLQRVDNCGCIECGSERRANI